MDRSLHLTRRIPSFLLLLLVVSNVGADFQSWVGMNQRSRMDGGSNSLNMLIFGWFGGWCGPVSSRETEGFHFSAWWLLWSRKICPKMQPIVASLITFINFQLQLKHWWPVFQFSFHHFLLFRDKCSKYRSLTDHRSYWDYLETKMILSCAERRGQPPHCGVPPPTLTPQITSSTSAHSYRRKQLQIMHV